MYFILTVGFFVLLLGLGWWLLRRALNSDEPPTAGGSFGDLALGEKNTRRRRRRGAHSRSAGTDVEPAHRDSISTDRTDRD